MIVSRISLLALAVSAVPVCASAQVLDAQVKIAGGTPFRTCTADQVGSQPGTNYPASAIEPWMAVNPTTAGHLLTGVQQDRWSDGGSRGLRAGVSTDGGHSWASSIPPGISQCTGGPFQRSTDPWTAFGLDGTAYYFSLGFNNNPTPAYNGESALLVSRSLDGGVSWGAPTTIIDDTDPLAFNDKNSLTADPNVPGNAYAVWDRLYGPADAFKAPGGSDEGNSAGDQSAASHDGLQRARNHLAMLRAGTAATAPETFGPTWFSRTTNSGLTWSRAVPIYDPGNNAQTIGNVIVGLPSGDLLDFFTLFTATGQLSIRTVRSKDHGLSWTSTPHLVTRISGAGPVTPDTQQPIRSEDIIFGVTADPVTGNMYVEWQDTPTPGAPVAVMFTQSTDGGQTWSPGTKISQTPANAANPLRGQAYDGAIGAVANGTLVATYYDFRRDTHANGHEQSDAWVVFCTPSASAGDCTNPANWGREQRLTEHSFDILHAPLTGSGYFLGDYFAIATQGTNAWPTYVTTVDAGRTTLYTRPIHLGVVSAQ